MRLLRNSSYWYKTTIGGITAAISVVLVNILPFESSGAIVPAAIVTDSIVKTSNLSDELQVPFETVSKSLNPNKPLTSNKRPVVAVYPLFPSPSVVNSPNALTALTIIKNKITQSLSTLKSIQLVDRSADYHPLSKSSKYYDLNSVNILNQGSADYIVTGLIEQINSTVVRLDLIHVKSYRLIKRLTLLHNDEGEPELEYFVDEIHSLIKADQSRRERSSDNRFDISLGGFSPRITNETSQKKSTQLRSLVTQKLLRNTNYHVLSRDYSAALILESALGNEFNEKNSVKSDVIIYGEFSQQNLTASRYSLTLYISRIGGLRKVSVVRANSILELAEEISQTITTELVPENVTKVSKSNRLRSEKLAREAWSIFKGPKSEFSTESLPLYLSTVRSLKNRVISKKWGNVEKAISLIEEAIIADSQNDEAQLILALILHAKNNTLTELAVINRLIWNSRKSAFLYGSKYLSDYFQSGSAVVHKSTYDEIFGEKQWKRIRHILLNEGLLRKGKEHPVYGYDYIGKSMGFPHPEASPSRMQISFNADVTAAREYIVYTRFGVAPRYITDPRDYNSDFGPKSGQESAVFYSIARPLSHPLLRVNKKKKTWDPIKVQLDGTQVPKTHSTYNYLSMIGASALINQSFLETQILYAKTICAYSENTCPMAKLLLENQINNTEGVAKNVSLARNRSARALSIERELLRIAKEEVLKLQKYASPTKLTSNIDSPIASIVKSVNTINETRLENEPKKVTYPSKCKFCTGIFKRNVSSTTPNGLWFTSYDVHDTAIARFGIEHLPYNSDIDHGEFETIKKELFKTELLSIKGYSNYSDLPKNKTLRARQHISDKFGHTKTNDILRGLGRSKKIKDAGAVTIFFNEGKSRQVLYAPNPYAKQNFGSHIQLQNNHLIICDRSKTSFEYTLEKDFWTFNKASQDYCNGRILNGDWSMEIHRSRKEASFINFHKRQDDSFELKQVRFPLDDYSVYFGKSPRLGKAWSFGDLTLVNSSSYYIRGESTANSLLVYALVDGVWEPSQIIHTRGEVYGALYHGKYFFLSTNARVVVFRKNSSDILEYVTDLRVGDNKYKNSISNTHVVKNNGRFHLVLTTGSGTVSWRIPQ